MHKVLFITLALFLNQSLAYVLITDSNRKNAGQHGGWGPHLRSIFTDNTGSLWYVDDEEDVPELNARVRYHKLGSQKWEEVATNEFYPAFSDIRQNTAHISNGTYIYSYGIDVTRNWLMECYLHTTNISYRACNAVFGASGLVSLPSGSQYIGAAITPSGNRVVWWTTIGNPGIFSYVYHNSTGWSDPINSPVTLAGNNYRFFGYVHIAFDNNNHAEVVGESKLPPDPTCTNTSTCFALAGSFDLGSPVTFQPFQGFRSSDIWYNSNDGSYHAFAFKQNGEMDYMYKSNPFSSWTYIQSLTDFSFARFNSDGTTLRVILASTQGNPQGLQVRSIPLNNINGAINWNSITPEYPLIASNGSMDAPVAIYVQSDSYQTTPVDFHFAIIGNVSDYDNNTWYFKKDW